MRNVDPRTVAGFDRIWGQVPGGQTSDGVDPESETAFRNFFAGFPLDKLADAEGFELGSGSGRIAASVAPRVGFLHCIDPAPAGIAAAKQAIGWRDNVRFHLAAVDAIPLDDESQDFGYSLGVLHHIPDPEAGLRHCVAKIKRGAPFLLYVYYDFENRPAWFRGIWRVSDVVRKAVHRLPFPARAAASTAIAAAAYWPLSRAARLLERLGVPVSNIPLSDYREMSWATLRADSLDRFGTALEHRFSRADIIAMMSACGLRDVRFNEGPPYWVAWGTKA